MSNTDVVKPIVYCIYGNGRVLFLITKGGGLSIIESERNKEKKETQRNNG